MRASVLKSRVTASKFSFTAVKSRFPSLGFIVVKSRVTALNSMGTTVKLRFIAVKFSVTASKSKFTAVKVDGHFFKVKCHCFKA